MLPPAESLGFIRYMPTIVKFDVFEFLYNNAPTEEDDLRIFLMSVLTYTEADFTLKYPDQPLLVEKFKAMQSLAVSIGLVLP